MLPLKGIRCDLLKIAPQASEQTRIREYELKESRVANKISARPAAKNATQISKMVRPQIDTHTHKVVC